MQQIIATVLLICIFSIKNKRALLRFQSTMAPNNRGWSACVQTLSNPVKDKTAYFTTCLRKETFSHDPDSLNIRPVQQAKMSRNGLRRTTGQVNSRGDL